MAKKLTSTLKQWYIKTLPGMNNKVEDLELKEKWVEVAQNCRFEVEPGAVDKRSAIAYFNTTSTGTGAVQSLVRFYTSGGVKKWVKIHTTSAYVGDDSAGTWTAIRSNLTTSKKTSFVTYKDLLIAGNGTDNCWVYDGSSDNVTWELGSCKAITGSSTGITATAASYQVGITLSDASEYICGAISNEIATLTNEDVELSNIPLGPSGSTNRKIYRKDSGTSSAYKLVTTISDNSTTTYTDTTPSASLGSNIAAVTDDMPKGSDLRIHRERLFISRDADYPSKIYYSNPYLPWFIQQTTELDYMEISPEDGDEIAGIPIQLGVMICIKKNTIRKLHITSPVSGASPTTWYADDPISFNGCPAPWTITQTPHGVAYLGWDHWYLFNGQSSTPIMDEFDTDDVLPARYSKVVAHWNDDVLLAAYTDKENAPSYNDRVMHYNFKRKTFNYDTYTPVSTHATADMGIECFASKNADDENNELYMGDSINGYVYKADNDEVNYLLRTKTEANQGTKTDTYVGGTESRPYIEVGATASASAIPDDICIFWDGPDTTPGDGWTEITDKDDKFICISSLDTVGTTGTIGFSGGTETQIDYLKYRVFKKNNTTTEYQFPDSAIIMWDQDSTPIGFQQVATGKYVRINSDITESTTGTAYIYPKTEHGIAGNLDNILELRFIKKIGEADTWDGLSEYVYAIYYASGAPGNGWTDVTETNMACTALDCTAVAAADTLTHYYDCAVNNGTDKFTDADHILEDGDTIRLGGTTVPTGTDTTTTYYIINKTDTTFQIATSEGGSAVDMSDDGTAVTYHYASLFSDDDRFMIGGTAPGGLDTTTVYYVVTAGVSTFQAALTSGGAAIDITDAGTDPTIIPITKAFLRTADNGPTKVDGGDTTSTIDFIQQPDAVHAYEGGGTGANGIDGDTDTAQSNSGSGSDGGGGVNLKSTHTFDQPRTLTSVYYKMSGAGAATGSYSRSHSASVSVEYSTDDGDTWTTLTGSSASCSGGDGGCSVSKDATWTGSIADVTDIRCNAAGAGSASGGSGSFSYSANIYEIQAYGYYGGDNYDGYVTFRLARKVLGQMQDYNDGWVNTYTAGTWTSPSIEIDALTLKSLYWNEDKISTSDIILHIRTGATQVACEAASWSTGFTDPNGSSLTGLTANVWLQYKIEFTCDDSVVSNPRVYFSDGFVVKIVYEQAANFAETAVEFIYDIGFRNFDAPFVDKIFKKIIANYEGSEGSLTVRWSTENTKWTSDIATPGNVFNVDLTVDTERWESFFPSTAMGRDLRCAMYKNDLYEFRLKEIKGIYTPEPILV